MMIHNVNTSTREQPCVQTDESAPSSRPDCSGGLLSSQPGQGRPPADRKAAQGFA